MGSRNIVLASGSPFRQRMLRQAGLDFSVTVPSIDERTVEAALAGSDVSPDDVAAILAEAKAVSVSESEPDALVIGSDQTLSLGDEIFHKPADMAAARNHLLRLSGKTHQLNSAVAIARNGSTVWRQTSIARMTMRQFEPAFVGKYLALVGAKALSSVGAYQVEAEGIQLFDVIDGDYFAIIGLPLLPLLAALRELGAIDG